MIKVWVRNWYALLPHRECKGHWVINHVRSQPSGRITGYVSLPLKEQLCLTFQVPLVLICVHKDLHASYMHKHTHVSKSEMPGLQTCIGNHMASSLSLPVLPQIKSSHSL